MLTLPLPPGAEPDTEPQPCPDIDWDTYSHYATWSTGPDGVDAEAYTQRQADVQRQGLNFAGEPHLCWTDADGTQIWAIALT